MKNLIQKVLVRRSGTRGTVVGILSDGDDKNDGCGVEYEVALEDEKAGITGAVTTVAWRASDVLLFDGTCVRFVGLVGAAHLNGRAGIIHGADVPNQRYNVSYVVHIGDPLAASGSSEVGKLKEARVRFRNVVL